MPHAVLSTLVDDNLKERLTKLVERGKRLLPWVSLASSVVGALLMDRSPKGAWLIVLLALLGWAAVAGFVLLSRLDPERLSGKRRVVVQVARFSGLVITQSLMQSCLLFALPIYVQAATFSVEQIAFLLLLVLASAATLWDPLYASVVGRPVASFALQGLAAFTAMNAVLPALGLSNRLGLVVAAAVAGVGAPLFAWLSAPPDARKKKAALAGAIAALLLPVGLATGGARAIPPAPLSLKDGAIGTKLSGLEVETRVEEVKGVPKALYCWTAIRAPRGLKDELFHIWRHEGRVTDEIPLQIRGGREEGFRTYSRKTRFGKEPWGEWSCSVVTGAGQLLGRRTVEIIRPEGG